MRATEFIIDNVEEKLKNVPTKPRNFVAKNAMKTTSGAGAHRDKKKEQKQGDFKHKNQGVAEGSEFGSYYYEKVAQEIFNKREDISSEDEVLNQAYKIVENDQGQKSARYMFNYDEDFPSDLVSAYFWLQKNQQGVAEVTGDKPFDNMMKTISKGTAKQATTDKKDQKTQSQQQSRDAFGGMFGGGNPASNLKIRKKGVEEGSKEDDPFDQGWRTFFRRGDESDNPYAKGSPEYAQWLDGFQEGRAQPRHYESVAVSEKAPPGEKAERMVKHIKKGYAKDGKLTDKERSIAYATAWKHHNK